MMNYTEALQRMSRRRDPEAVITLEKYGSLKEDDPVKYLVGAMSEIPEHYTKKSYDDAARVQNQVLKGLARDSRSAEFRIQGSVTKNTHILAYSDIDVLSIEVRFYNLESPQEPLSPYYGDPVDDLCTMRKNIEETLPSAFPKAEVDTGKSKCVAISGGSLSRTVEVVPSNWWNTNRYASSGQEVDRGVHVLDYFAKTREPDTPFLHASLFVTKDVRFTGNLRKLVRLCKSLKYDSGRNDIPSSYDIEALTYAMRDDVLFWSGGKEIQLATACSAWLKEISESEHLRNTLTVPDGKRRIFAPGKTTLVQLNALRDELDTLLANIYAGLARRGRSLSSAEINYMVNPF